MNQSEAHNNAYTSLFHGKFEAYLNTCAGQFGANVKLIRFSFSLITTV